MSRKAILFDLDDTLLKTYPIKWRQHKETARRFYGITLKNNTLRKHWGLPTPSLVGYLYQNSDTTENMVASFTSLNGQFLKDIHEDVIEVLDQLKQSGHFLGIITNSSRQSAILDMERLGLPRKTFDSIHGIEDTKAYKPDPRAFTLMMREIRERSIKEIVYVGDSLNDYYAAQVAGVAFIGIARGVVSEKEFRNVGAERVIYKLHELLTPNSATLNNHSKSKESALY